MLSLWKIQSTDTKLYQIKRKAINLMEPEPIKFTQKAKIKKQLTKYSKKVEDKAIIVKLNETKNLLKPLCKKSSVHDDNVTNLLNYYELINELKTIHG